MAPVGRSPSARRERPPANRHTRPPPAVADASSMAASSSASDAGEPYLVRRALSARDHRLRAQGHAATDGEGVLTFTWLEPVLDPYAAGIADHGHVDDDPVVGVF